MCPIVPQSHIGKFLLIEMAIPCAIKFQAITSYAMKEIGSVVSTQDQVALGMIGTIQATEMKATQGKIALCKMRLCGQ